MFGGVAIVVSWTCVVVEDVEEELWSRLEVDRELQWPGVRIERPRGGMGVRG